MPREYDPKLVEKSVHTIQMLSVDGVEKAKVGSPRHADGARGHRVRDLDAAPALRPERRQVARSRPLRPLVRARVDAALLDAPPRGLRPAARRAQALPPVGLEDAGPSRVVP